MKGDKNYKNYIKEVEKSYDENAEIYTEAEEAADVIQFNRKALSLLPPLNKGMILDAGCGPGIFCELLAQEGKRVVGIDISSRLLDIGERRCEKFANCNFCRMSVEDMGFKKESFDVVLSAFEVMYHKDLKKVLKIFYRILKGGGSLLLLVPHPARNMGMHKPLNYFKTGLFRERWGIGMESRKYYLTLEGYVNSLIDCGFTINKIWEPLPPRGKTCLYDVNIKFPHKTVYPQALVVLSQKT